MHKQIIGKSYMKKVSALVLAAITALTVCVFPLSVKADPAHLSHLTGGGYSASGQINGAGYTAQIYDASSGLPTSDANFILTSSDGYIWIGG